MSTCCSTRVLLCCPISEPFYRYMQAGSLIKPTCVKYFCHKNYSADFSETRGIDWTLLRTSNEVPHNRGSYGNIPHAKKITCILARPQNEKVEKAASRKSKNIDNEAKSLQIRPLTSS